MKRSKSVWISWENHIRTNELAKALSVQVHVVSNRLPKGLMHLANIVSTVKLLFDIRPELLFVQNPSRILAFLAVCCKFVFSYKVIVDRHTNFRIGKTIGFSPIYLILTFMSNISVRYADLTIVTNEYLQNIVIRKGGKSFILTDKIPELKKIEACPNRESAIRKIVYICSFEDDEPLEEVFAAVKKLPENIVVHITGDYNKRSDIYNQYKHFKQLVFTGYLPRQEYIDTLNSANLILVLTKAEWCLLCGGYEALALEKPLIITETMALKQYYGNNVIFTNNSSDDIFNSIVEFFNYELKYRKKITELKRKKIASWELKFEYLKSEIKAIQSK